MRLAVRCLASTLALAEYKGVGQTCPARSNVNRSTSGVVKRRQIEEPSVGVPGPAGDRAVHDSGPEEGKDQTRQDASTFERTTNHDLHCACAEEQLVETEHDFGNVGITGRRCH